MYVADRRLLQRDLSWAPWSRRVGWIAHDALVTHHGTLHTWRHHWVAPRRLACRRHRQVTIYCPSATVSYALGLIQCPRKLKVKLWCHVQGKNFAVPEDIAAKISEDLPMILATPHAKFQVARWSPGGENRDQTK